MLESALRVFGIVFPVIGCAAAGWLYGRYQRPDMGVVNRINMDIFMPMLLLWALLDKPFDSGDFLGLAIGGVVVILGSGLLVLPLVWLFKINWKTFLPPMMFNNTGNMGIPLVLFAFGEEMLQAAILLFIIEMTLHFTLGLYMLEHRIRLRSLLSTPIIIATALGLLGSYFQLSLPVPLLETIKLLGQVAIPLLLFALGVRLLEVDFSDWKLGAAGALLCPAVGLLALWPVLPYLSLDVNQQAVLILFAVMPPAVLNVLVAEEYQQEPQRVASIVLLGNMGSLLIVPLVLWFLL